MATKEENKSVAPQQDVLKTSQPVNQNRKVVREQKIALIQRLKSDGDDNADNGARLTFEADEHGARPGMMVLDANAAKSIPEGDNDRGYIVVYDDGSTEWKPSSEVEKK